jgi:hypothetical protein
LASEEVADGCRDFLGVGFQREMSRVKEVDLGIGQITLEGFSSCRQEERVDVRESS